MAAGTRLGPYEVVAPIGAGGMGEVWRGRDTRLERSVAIKILPAEFAENTQFKLRFEREAKTISQLNHPHICTLYDVGENYLVMELLEGESLAERIAKGPLPLEQVVRYGVQIADALDKAHRAGIIHRDLKPGNIMITKSGAKLLDFGLAKPTSVFEIDGATHHKPLTQEGTIVGTFQYMAPEQIEDGQVDARTDIFALGAVLYEMATGKRAFDGKSKASLIASILTAEPQPITAVQPMTPASFDRVIRTCLQKEPDDRWQSAHDVATELRWVSEAPSTTTPRRARSLLVWSMAAILGVISIALAVALWRKTESARNEPAVRTLILPPENTTFDFLGAAAPPAVSPDGKRIVFGAVEPGKKRMLYVRPLDSLVAQQLIGTEGATFPFWSPDGRFIGFFVDNALKKLEVIGGAPVTLCSVIDGRGGSWSPDGQTIIFTGRFAPIYRVPSAGGTPSTVTTLEGRDVTHRFPQFLPDSHHFLFLASPNGGEDPANAICVGDVDGKIRKPLIPTADEPHYVNGAIVFARDRILTAQRFDVKKLAVVGEAVPLKEQEVQTTPLFAKSVVSIAPNGTLVYQAGSAPHETQLGWFDRSGKILGKVGDNDRYATLSLSPDSRMLAVSYTRTPQSNIWTFDLVRGVKTRVTFGKFDVGPLWSPDGRKLIYTSVDSGKFKIRLKDLATGAEEELFSGDALGSSLVSSWSPDGHTIFYNTGSLGTRADIFWMALADRKQNVYLKSEFVETTPRVSPDGKWVAYQSNESGVNEVYLAPFPPTGAKWQVSTGNSVSPRWRSDGKELFFVAMGTPAAMMAVPITLGATPEIGQAVKLFQFQVGFSSAAMYDVTRDGQRFLINTRIGDEPPPAPMILLQHFDNELRAALEHRQ
ncbi:MAG TPA: protein kinase [Thermoanaerobaculia bacterium]|nr:protein kinase [Thermoanaerobaculia bacterium]